MRWILALGAILIAVGIAMASLAFQEWNVLNVSKANPEELTLRELIDRGTDAPASIVLKEFILADNPLLEKRGSLIRKAWVPAVAPQGIGVQRAGNLTQFAVLLYIEGASDSNDVYKKLEKNKLPGLVLNRVVPLPVDDLKALQANYPDNDFGKCLIVQIGREPPLQERALAFLGVGGLLLLLGLMAVWLAIRKTLLGEAGS